MKTNDNGMWWIGRFSAFLWAIGLTLALSSGASAQGVMTNGATHEGAISVAGEVDTWTFDATAGDFIILRVGQVTDTTGNFEPQILLLSPSNAQLGTSVADIAAEVTTTAPATGTYTVTVRDGNLAHSGDSTNNTGTYRLHLAKSPGAFTVSAGDEGGALLNGATQSGTIHAGDLDMWSFTASAGDAIIVRVGEVTDDGNFEPTVRLYSPTGVQLGASPADLAAEVSTSATTSGTYTVVISDWNLAHSQDSLGNTGTYRLHLAKSPGAFIVSAGDEGGALINGAITTGTIHLGDLDMWSFTAGAGDTIIVRAGQVTDDGNFEPIVRLYSPDGVQLGASPADLAAEVATTALTSGTYTVVISDWNLAHSGDSLGNTGTYRLHLAKSPGAFVVNAGDEGGDLINGAIANGTIHLGDLDMWSFNASAGDAIIVRAGEVTDDGNFEPIVRLYSPNGVQLGASPGDIAAEVATTAPTSGTYTVVISDWNLAHSGDSLGNTGTYRLHLARSSGGFTTSGGDEGGELINGAVTPGTIHVGDLDLWSFTASTGDAILVRAGEVTDGGNFEPIVRLYSPTGTQLGASPGDIAAEVATTAPADGVYLVVVSDWNLAHSGDSLGNTGTYRLHLAKSPGAFVVSAGDEGGNLINGATQPGTIHTGDLDMWSFSAEAGDAIVVRAGEVTDAGNFEPIVRLYSPEGGLVGQGLGDVAAEATTTAATSGVYTVVVSDWNLAHSGDSLGNTGTYRLHLARTPGRFVVGDEGGIKVPAGSYAGTIHAGDLDMWSFCANAGDPLNLVMTETLDNGNFEPSIRLYGPTGTLLRSNFADVVATSTIAAPGPGTYTAVVGDWNLAHSGDSLGNTGTYSLVLTGNAGCSATCVAPPDDLVSWWPGDGNAHDVQDGNDGALQGGAAFGAGKVGQGFSLDGVDDFVNIPESGNLNLISSFTWEAWVRPSSTANNTVVMSKDVSDSNRVVLEVLTGGVLCGRFDDAVNPGSVTCSPASVVPAGQFTHIAMVLDDAADTMRLYANGVLVASRSGVGNPASNTAPMRLGRSVSGGFFAGIIDEAAVFSRALSGEEVLSIFEASSAGKCRGCLVPCDDANPCTDDSCDQGTGQCIHTNNTHACNDGNACTQTDTCQGGSCSGSNPVICTASDQCHLAGTCSPGTGACSNPAAPNGTGCSDGDPCTGPDTCSGGACVGGGSTCGCASNAECNDSNPCTNDTCQNPGTPSALCVHANNTAPCDDGVFCNGADTCSGGACGHAGDPCAAGAACNNTCNEAADNCFAPNGTGCTSDGNPCTDDRCNGSGVCQHPNNTASCDDGNACTQTDACQSGACTGSNSVVCAASDQCHDAGTCNPANGVCSNPSKPNGTTCDDGDECTTSEMCMAGSCTGGASTCSEEDLAVVKMKVPKTIKLTESKPTSTKRVAIKIQNRSPSDITIPSAAALAGLVELNIESLGETCGSPQAALVAGPPNSVPRTVKSKKTVQVFFDVTFDCANDPLKNTASSPGHEDFRYTAILHRSALDGTPDAHPQDDVCPRDPLGTDPHPDGTIVDKGCGGPRGGGTFGEPLTTDVFRK